MSLSLQIHNSVKNLWVSKFQSHFILNHALSLNCECHDFHSILNVHNHVNEHRTPNTLTQLWRGFFSFFCELERTWNEECLEQWKSIEEIGITNKIIYTCWRKLCSPEPSNKDAPRHLLRKQHTMNKKNNMQKKWNTDHKR